MPTFSGRLEARCTVPTGGAAVSVTIPNGAGASTKTVPAGNYYMTAAGGVSSLTTALQSALNDGTGGYPQTAAAMAAAVGYGDWTGGDGYLFNESSGNAVAVYGAPDLTPVNTPTYGFAGPRGGIDKAIGFDGSTDAFTGGNVNDLVAATDLLVAGVIYFDGLDGGTNDDIISKGFVGGVGGGFYICREGAALSCYFTDGASTVHRTVAVPASTWLAFMYVADRTNQTARIAVAPISTGVATVSASASIAAVGSPTNANSFNVGNNGTNGALAGYLAAMYITTGAGKALTLNANISQAVTNLANAINASWVVAPSATDGRVSIGWTGYVTPTWSLAWTSTVLRDVLGFTADIAGVTTTQTGANQSALVWFPDSPMNCDDHPSMTPEETDLRTSESPTGIVLGLCGNTKYVHSNVRYQRVPVDRIREASATYDNASLEVFFRNTQAGQGITWFTPASPVQVYWSNAGSDVLLGADANSGAGVAGWTVVGVSSFSKLARLSQDGYVGQFDVTFPRLVSDGS